MNHLADTQLWSTGVVKFSSQEALQQCLAELNSIHLVPQVTYDENENIFSGNCFNEEFVTIIAQYLGASFSVKSLFHNEAGAFTGGWVDFYDAKGERIECVALDDLIAKNTNQPKEIKILSVKSNHAVFDEDNVYEVQRDFQGKLDNGEITLDGIEKHLENIAEEGDEHHLGNLESHLRMMNEFDPVDNFMLLKV